MSKEIKDYLHLYLGFDIQYPFITIVERRELRIGKLYGVKGDYCFLKTNYGFKEERIANCKPILRPLSDMSDEEQFEMSDITGLHINDLFVKALQEGTKYVIDVRNSFEVTRYLLSKHFDLFGFIEAGLAIDKTKIT